MVCPTKFSLRRIVQSLVLTLSIVVLGTAAPLTAESKPAAIFPHPALAAVPPAAQFDSAGHLNPEAATQEYLSMLSVEKRRDSDKYFEGGYWLILWDAVYTIAALLLLLYSGVSARIRSFATQRTGSLWLQTAIYFVLLMVALTVLGFPMNWYEGFYREHLYEQSHQAFGGWLKDSLIALVVSLVLGAILVPLLYAIARRLPRTWHLWAAAAVWGFGALVSLAAPVFISPLFNTYTRLEDPAVTVPILQMARANGIPVSDLYQVDASKQTTQVSANVSGLFNTTRITLNDNLLRTASVPEIEAVTGHEMGHYVLHHVWKGLLASLILIVGVFLVLRGWLESMQRRHGAQWGTTSIFDPALLPAAMLIFTVLGLLLTPVTKTVTRMDEHEADIFGLNASRQPDGFALSMLKLGQYRKLSPGPMEEIIFFDHPSGHTRILDAMRWKSQNQGVMGYK